MSILGFIFFIIVAAICAWIAEAIVPGRIPGGFLASAIVGIIGAWIGTALMGHMGPDLAGVPLLPAIVGSAVLVFLLALISGFFVRTTV
ncbi:MAG TPA: GlsB/YeaQ/YmgE family stress response membrane protein [Candidatus Obscuribacterales bacterium]